MSTAEIIGASLGLVIIVTVLWKVVRVPRHGKGNHDAWTWYGEGGVDVDVGGD